MADLHAYLMGGDGGDSEVPADLAALCNDRLVTGPRLMRVYMALRPAIQRGVDAANSPERRRRAILNGHGSSSLIMTRLSEFIALQHSPLIRDALKRMTRDREWRHVTFAEFVHHLIPVARRLIESAQTRRRTARAPPTCVVVDGFFKSSFWVLMLILHVSMQDASLQPVLSHLLRTNGLMACIDVSADYDMRKMKPSPSSHGHAEDLAEMLSTLPDGTCMALVDDAVYTGIQLSATYRRVRLQWQLSRVLLSPGAPPPATVPLLVCVPFVSRPAEGMFGARGTRLAPHVSFSGLFHRRSAAAVLRMDVFFVAGGRRSIGRRATAYESYLFDFLGLYPDQTVLLFEHKIADDLSIPYRWLHMGPCLSSPEDVRLAYRVRTDRADLLVTLLRSAVRDRHFYDSGVLVDGLAVTESGLDASGRLPFRAYAHLVVELMHSPRFRAMYMEGFLTPASEVRKTRVGPRVIDRDIDDDEETPTPEWYPRYMPLIPPQYCDARYRRFLMHELEKDGRRGAPGSSGVPGAPGVPSRRMVLNMPECQTPPYRSHVFKTGVVDAVAHSGLRL